MATKLTKRALCFLVIARNSFALQSSGLCGSSLQTVKLIAKTPSWAIPPASSFPSSEAASADEPFFTNAAAIELVAESFAPPQSLSATVGRSRSGASMMPFVHLDASVQFESEVTRYPMPDASLECRI
jgi:hypothetical protein